MYSMVARADGLHLLAASAGDAESLGVVPALPGRQPWWQRGLNQSFRRSTPKQREFLLEADSKSLPPSRTACGKQFEGIQGFEHDDARFFAETLLGDSDAARAKGDLGGHVSPVDNGTPLRIDVPLSASPAQVVKRAVETWLAHGTTPAAAEFQPPAAAKTVAIVADTQYAHMVWRLVTFNLGRSALKTREPVSEKLWEAFIISAPLMLMAEVFIYLVAVPLGVLCAVERGRLTDRVISLGLFLLYSIPPVVAGMMFLLYLCYGDYLKIFPMQRLHSDGWEHLGTFDRLSDYLWHAFLPVISLSLFSLAGIAMYSCVEHARRDRPGLRPHRPGQGIVAGRGDPETCRPQRTDSDHHAVRQFFAGDAGWQRAGGISVQHSGTGDARLRVDRAEGFSDGDGADLHRRHPCAGQHS